MSMSDLDQILDQYHQALDEFARGNHEPAARLWSHREDVTLGNPFGPFVRGPEQIMQAMQRAASNYRDGKALGFDLIAKEATPELAYLVEVERLSAKMGGRDDLTPMSLRVTSVFRNEHGAWRLVHRHADPITTERSADSVIQR